MDTLNTVNTLSLLSGIRPIYILAAVIWTLAWKGLALWRSAQLRQKYWFVIILLINTLGLLDIIYLFLVARRYKVEIVEKSE